MVISLFCNIDIRQPNWYLKTVRSVDQDLIYEQIGREIAQYRTSIGLSQADLARSIGLTRSSISNIEKGRQKMLVHTLLELSLIHI